MTELLNCPFCGSKAKIDEGEDGEKDLARIFCSNKNCAVDMLEISFYSEEKEKRQSAIDRWNTRA